MSAHFFKKKKENQPRRNYCSVYCIRFIFVAVERNHTILELLFISITGLVDLLILKIAISTAIVPENSLVC